MNLIISGRPRKSNAINTYLDMMISLCNSPFDLSKRTKLFYIITRYCLARFVQLIVIGSVDRVLGTDPAFPRRGPNSTRGGGNLLLPTVREVNAFRSVCQSFCSQGGSASEGRGWVCLQTGVCLQRVGGLPPGGLPLEGGGVCLHCHSKY